MSKRYLRSLSFLLILILLINLCTACFQQSRTNRVQDDFNQFLNEIFIQQVQSDSLSLNYSLENPEKFGIQITETTLGEYSVQNMNKGVILTENYLNRLNSYDYEALSHEQRITYDVLKSYLETDLNFGNFIYYNESLGPTTGLQAQLPILLAEFSFYEKEDIDRYLDLLSCVYDYFKDIAEFEREKSKRGLFMSDAVADHIIAQCKAFIEEPEQNFLIEYFNEKITKFDGLTQEEINSYKNKNYVAVISKVIPAYQLLISVLSDLKGTGKNNAGLYYFPDGQAYYECLARYKTGSARSMEEIASMMERAISDNIFEITRISVMDDKIMDKFLSFHSFPITDPEEILQDLQQDISKDFPESIPVNCEIKYVPESMSDFLSPAMYLIPPIDNYKNNNIYINGSDEDTLSMIYTTVAHEGYPGHLYQCVYFRDQNPSPIRSLLNFNGYDEGWATYVEFYSYQLAGIDPNLADFLKANNIVILCMYARTDIGIHYEGWKMTEAVDYIMKYINDEDIAKQIYTTLLEEPAIYLPYAVGYLEIMELRNKAEQSLGADFVAKDFHQFLLDMGPAPFSVIEEYMEQWINDRIGA